MSSGSVYRGLKCTRGYATAASKPVGPSLRLGCPPIQLQGLSGKYASALYSAAIKKDEKIVSTVEKDLSSFQQRWFATSANLFYVTAFSDPLYLSNNH
ncbi:hypothetical protein H4Q26_012976 [Puccinia striiformis f. sp. tritici PST-130]|nr:hypothetical protein H4Q26_012976 [Puccinia striiformis f. sp. tritici PST-130]